MSTKNLLEALGGQIRAARAEAGLTQALLGDRAGIVGKYVSEIERGTRDIPVSTLAAIVERGLARDLDIVFRRRERGTRIALPHAIDEVAVLIAELPQDQQTRILAIVRSILSMVR